MAESNLKKLMPIIGMAFLFIIGILFALILSPIFISMNARADFSEFGGMSEESVFIVVIYMGAILAFTGVLLLLGRRKKGKFLKYIIVGVVGITIVYTLMPLIGYAMHGPLTLDWGVNDSIDEETTILLTEDIDGDGEQEIIIGTRSGSVQIYDIRSHKREWKSPNIGADIRALEIIDIDRDGSFELAALSDQNLNIYARGDPYGFESLYEDTTGEISAFTFGDYDNDDIFELYYGTRLGELRSVSFALDRNDELDAADPTTLNASIVDTVSAVYYFYDPPTNGTIGRSLLIVGTEDGTGLYYPANGTGADNINQGFLSNIRTPLIIKSLDLTGAELVDGQEQVLYIHTRGKSLYILDPDDFSLITQVSGIREFGSYALVDLLDEYDGYELILNGNGQLKVLYSNDALWDEYVDPSSLIADYDPAGRGAAAVDLEGGDELEVVLGTTKGYTYGELELIQFSNVPCLAAAIIAVVLVLLLLLYPEWYIVDITGIMIGAGVCAIIGISIAVFPILLFLVVLAIYDAISVYKTKHMIDLADNVMEMRLPIVLVIPKKLSYSYLDQKGLKEQLEKKTEREAMFMGLGDVIIPGTLAVSSLTFLSDSAGIAGIGGNVFVALGVLIGAVFGFIALMRYVMRGNPQAGLPLLNSGAIIGYLITYIIVYQDLSFGLSGVI